MSWQLSFSLFSSQRSNPILSARMWTELSINPLYFILVLFCLLWAVYRRMQRNERRYHTRLERLEKKLQEAVQLANRRHSLSVAAACAANCVSCGGCYDHDCSTCQEVSALSAQLEEWNVRCVKCDEYPIIGPGYHRCQYCKYPQNECVFCEACFLHAKQKESGLMSELNKFEVLPVPTLCQLVSEYSAENDVACNHDLSDFTHHVF